MGIVRLAKILRLFNSITEYDNRSSDIKNKISGNRVYMDFISIVYKIQINVINELNYLLFSFILLKMNLLNTSELISEKFLSTIKKYKLCIKNYDEFIKIIESMHSDIASNNTSQIDIIVEKTKLDLNMLILSPSSDNQSDFIVYFENMVNSVNSVNSINSINEYIYQSVIDFITDMLTKKIINVEYVLIAFDGIPSFGKIQEQRQRRYMRYTFVEFQKHIINRKISDPNTLKSDIESARLLYDANHFQVDIKSAIDYVYSKYHSTDLQANIIDNVNLLKNESNTTQNTKIIVEVIDKKYGEGEKILMDKVFSDYQIFKDDKTYVFYSPDGDSVILCLYIYIKAKIKSLTVIKAYSVDPTDYHNEQTQYVDTKTLYDNIVANIEKYSKDTYDVIEDKDNICTDFILLINFFGNDFIHQIPTMEISTTIMDLMYVYSKFIRDNNNSHKYLTKKISNVIHIDYQNLKSFLIYLADFEQFIMLDTYLSDVDDKNKILRYFGNVFPCRYLIDYRDSILLIKKEIYTKIKSEKKDLEYINQIITDAVNSINKKVTVTGKKYGEIWVKIEIKNISEYATKILSDPESLLTRYPRFIHNLRSRKNRNEKDIRNIVNMIESDLIKLNQSIDLHKISESNNKQIKDFSFDYGNIRILVPHNQMPTTDQDIDLYLLEWKSGKWMNILNSASFEIGYDWRKEKQKKIEYEMRRYQYDMLEINNTAMERMVSDWLKTLSWICDYYMNTNLQTTCDQISTWSYNYDRSPFISHIANYLEKQTPKDIKYIMKGFYKRSLINSDQYLKSDKHRFYIYPQSSQIIEKLPAKYKIFFPNMLDYVQKSIKLASHTKYIDKSQRFFDCRMCPYFSKCIFKSRHMTFNELINFDINRVIEYKILKRPDNSKKILPKLFDSHIEI